MSSNVRYFFMFFIKLRNTNKEPNRFEPDRVRHFVGPDLGPSCLQRLSADDNTRHKREES